MRKVILTMILCLCTTMVVADESGSDNTSQRSPALILQDAQIYLNNITSLKANFIQSAPDGSVAEGTLYLRRPGHMRWEYHPPVPVLIVTSGTILRYYDTELEQISDMPMQGTLAELLAQDHVDFNDERIELLDVRHEDGVEIVAITRRGEEDEGSLTFVFDTSPRKLRTIIMKDAKDEDTIIALGDAEYNIPLKDKLFVLENAPFLRKGGRFIEEK